jgi:transposase
VINLLELCENLKIEIENLKAENKALKIENAQLKERLGLNSKNSSLPSSKELYKKEQAKKRKECWRPGWAQDRAKQMR